MKGLAAREDDISLTIVPDAAYWAASCAGDLSGTNDETLSVSKPLGCVTVFYLLEWLEKSSLRFNRVDRGVESYPDDMLVSLAVAGA